MKLLLLANEAPEDFALRENKEEFDSYMGAWFAFGEGMRNAGIDHTGAALEPPATATVVSVRDGVRHVEDGPYPDSKEQLGGFALFDAPDIETGAKWAAKCPAAERGFVDVRVIPSFEEHTK